MAQSLSPKQVYDEAPDIIQKVYKCLASRYKAFIAPTANYKFMFTMRSLYDDVVLTYEIPIENKKQSVICCISVCKFIIITF